MIKNLVFDFGKVLVDYDFLPVLDSFFLDNKEMEREFCDIVITPEFTAKCDKGEQTFEEVIKEAQGVYPKFADALEFFHDRYVDFVTGEMPGMRGLLAELKAQGFRLYGLTNWCHKVYEVMPLFPVFSLLDGFVVSSDERLLKPERAIYECLCSRFSLTPSECVFTDDVMKNIEGARAAGMHAILFKGAEDYRKSLMSMLSCCNE